MDDLIEFLRACIDEDESKALAAGNRRWLVEDNTISLWPDHEDDGFMRWPTRADARHAANWDPTRVLREVESNRQLLEQFRLRGDSVRQVVQPATGGVWDDLLRMLALRYDDREGYREEWRP